MGVNKSIQIPFPSLQNWHSCALTYDGLNMKAYMDGILVGTESLSGSYVSSNAIFYLGNWNQQELFEGQIDNPTVWSKALTQIEIQTYMSCPPTGNETSLVGYWNFNEGSGSTVIDLTSNGNNGTINGASWSTQTPSQYCNNCTATDSIYVNITPQDDASFTYSASSYCSDDTDPSPTISGTTGGTFSSTSGLVMTNGVIDLDASTAGTYTITYTTSGACAASSTQDITITAPTTDFNYGGDTVFCQGSVNPVATIIGTSGGTFSAGTGLVIDSITGEIDLGSSVPGNYQVSYNQASLNIWENIKEFYGDSLEDKFGYSVDVNYDGTRIVVSAPNTSGSYVRVFESTNLGWVQLGQDISTNVNYHSVSINGLGNRIALGSPEGRRVSIYDFSNSAWNLYASEIKGLYNRKYG